MAFFARERCQIHYEIVDGIVPHDLLLIHGNLASNAWWTPLINCWKANPHPQARGRVIAAEWRGCGKSRGELSAEDLRPEKLAADYSSLLDFLSIQQVHVIGHSLGGLISLCLLAARPDICRRGFLLSPVPPGGTPVSPEKLTAFREMQRSKVLCAAVVLSTISHELPEALTVQIVEDAFSVDPLLWTAIPPRAQTACLGQRSPTNHSDRARGKGSCASDSGFERLSPLSAQRELHGACSPRAFPGP